MPKKPPRNSFYFFMLHFKEEQRKKGVILNNMFEVAEAAGPAWKVASPGTRRKYEEMAKIEKQKNNIPSMKYTTYGERISDVEQRAKDEKDAEEKEQKDIKNIVKLKAFNDGIVDLDFFLMDVNYYCQVNNHFVICEFSIIRFNLRQGIRDVYHEIVHPGSIPTGYTSDAKIACEELGLELPDSTKSPSNYMKILANIIEYLEDQNERPPLPPIYTMPDKVLPVRNFISQICYKSGEDEARFRIYKLNTMFFFLINSVAKNVNEGLPKESLALVQLQKDQFQYSPGLECEIHENGNKFLNCTSSRVKRWAFSILDYCCPLVNVVMVAGIHLPNGLDLKAIATVKEQKMEKIRSESCTSGVNTPDVRSSCFTPIPSCTTPNFNDASQFPSLTASSCASTSFDLPKYKREHHPLRKPKVSYFKQAPGLTEDNFPKLSGRGRGSHSNLTSDIGNVKIGQ